MLLASGLILKTFLSKGRHSKRHTSPTMPWVQQSLELRQYTELKSPILLNTAQKKLLLTTIDNSAVHLIQTPGDLPNLFS